MSVILSFLLCFCVFVFLLAIEHFSVCHICVYLWLSAFDCITVVAYFPPIYLSTAALLQYFIIVFVCYLHCNSLYYSTSSYLKKLLYFIHLLEYRQDLSIGYSNTEMFWKEILIVFPLPIVATVMSWQFNRSQGIFPQSHVSFYLNLKGKRNNRIPNICQGTDIPPLIQYHAYIDRVRLNHQT